MVRHITQGFHGSFNDQGYLLAKSLTHFLVHFARHQCTVGRTTSLWKEKKSLQSMLGEETTISIAFNFTSQQLSDSNIYEMIQLRGPGPDVDMELLEFTLRAVRQKNAWITLILS